MTATVPQAALSLRNVLIATDFSSCSERALLHAVAAAHHFGSTLHVVHVIKPTTFSLVPPEAYVGTCEAENIAMELARSDAQCIVGEVLRRTHCDNVDHHSYVFLGDVGHRLCDFIRREHIDLAVIGTHGRTGLHHLLMGSVAEDVFRHATCPVLTVGPHSWRSDPHSLHLRNILYPTDLSVNSAKALPFVMATAREFGSTLTLLNVVEHLPGDAAQDRTRITAALEQKMREMACLAGPLPRTLKVQVEFGDVSKRVIEVAAELKADMIALGLKSPDTYAERLPWMHAYKIICEVDCPVLSIRGRYQERA